MAKLFIAEFAELGFAALPVATIPVAKLPPPAGQVVTFTTSTQSAALNAATTFVRVMADADCHIEVGSNPTATTSSTVKLTAGSAEYFGVTPGHKIAAVTA